MFSGRRIQHKINDTGPHETDPIDSYLIDRADDIHPDWLDGVQWIGLTAGASAPDLLVNEVIEKLQAWGVESVRTLSGREESVTFSLPRQLAEP